MREISVLLEKINARMAEEIKFKARLAGFEIPSLPGEEKPEPIKTTPEQDAIMKKAFAEAQARIKDRIAKRGK